MTEATQVDDAVRRHLGPLGHFKRVTHATEAGWPDFHFVLRGQQGWLEDKLIPPSRRCPSTFTLDQLRWGEAEVAAGGSWHLLGLEPRTRTWMLFNVVQAGMWFAGRDGYGLVVEATGVFPTKELVLALAPRRS